MEINRILTKINKHDPLGTVTARVCNLEKAWNTVEPCYSKPLNCGHLSVTAACCLSQLHPEMWLP